MPKRHPTKQRLLDAGLVLLLEHGYNDMGIAALLERTSTPKGSFYHHFLDKEDFALAVVDAYMVQVHAGLDQCLLDPAHPPLERIRRFFEMTARSYEGQGYRGCLLGGLGQELAGISEVFRRRLAECLAVIGDRLAVCLDAARVRGELPAATDTADLARLLVDCWEGAALRSRLVGSGEPLARMLDFYFQIAVAPSVGPC